MQLTDARKETFDHIELFDAPAMFTDLRIDRSTVPEGLFCYDVRGTGDDPGALYVIEPFVYVNHSGTIIGVEDYMLEKGQAKYIATHINFLGSEITLDEFCAKHSIEISEPKKGVLASGVILGILSGITLVAAVVLFFKAGVIPGVIILAIAFLISPYGLPRLAAWLTGKIGGINYALWDFLAS